MNYPSKELPLIGTLGMFIIDTFSFYDSDHPDAKPTDRGLGKQIGGGGTYFMIGSRIFLPPHQLLMVIDRGHDFPPETQEVLDNLSRNEEIGKTNQSQALWRFRDRAEGIQTTMAVNIYRGEHRSFEYLTPKQRLDPPDLLTPISGSPSSSLSKFLHCICSPDRAMQICDEVERLDLDSERIKGGSSQERTKIVWEPIPDSCRPENLEVCLKVMERVDIFSPNHEEAASFLGLPSQSLEVEDSSSKKKHKHDHLISILASNFSKKCANPIVCIRCGALGSVIGREDLGWRWVEAWHSKELQDRVVDVTGAGNGFLGGLTACLAKSKESTWSLDLLEEAAMHGSVSASFIVEQLGLPSISKNAEGLTLWNGDSSESRLKTLKSRS